MDRITRFGKDVLNGWLEAGAFTLAAALAYYAIFSIAPLLLISIYLASFFLDRSAAVEGLTNEMIGVIGPSGSDAIKEMLDAAGTAQPQGWAGLVAIRLVDSVANQTHLKLFVIHNLTSETTAFTEFENVFGFDRLASGMTSGIGHEVEGDFTAAQQYVMRTMPVSELLNSS